MNFKTYIGILLFAFAAAFQVNAQGNIIGYTNVEFILASMPEAKSMQKTLGTYQQKLGEKLQVKEKYVQQKYQEYMQKKEGGATEATLKPLEEELLKLDAEVQQMAAELEQQLLKKQQELLEPILTKLQEAIDKVAEEKGYKYVLNQTTSAGVSTILVGPAEADVTEAVFAKLGIAMPKE